MVRLAATWLVLFGTAVPGVQADPGEETAVLSALQTRIEKVAEEVGRSVVSIETKGKAPEAVLGFDRGNPWDTMPPELRRFFGDRRPESNGDTDRGDEGRDLRRFRQDRRDRGRAPREELVPRGLGSGIIISSEGVILTNQHVVNGADEITVTLADKKQFKATLVGQDVRRDLAVLKIEATGLPAARLDSGSDIRRGMFVLAVGSPFGFGAEGQASVSFGIVSGTRRSLALGTNEDRYYGKLIQTDAAINPGNSGGALCDLDGKVIGINVAIASRSGGSQGVGFAIPVDALTRRIIDQLKRGESVAYGYLGVGIRNPTTAESETAGAPAGVGAFVISVEPESPAAKAGILPADLIVSLGGKALKDSDDLVVEVGRTEPGAKVSLDFYRSGKKMEVEAEVVRRAVGEVASRGPRERPAETSQDMFRWRGLGLKDLTPALRRDAGVGDEAKGVFIDSVEEDSQAYKGGIRAGSVIDQVGSAKVETLADFKKGVSKLKGRVFVNIVGQGPEIVAE